LSYALLPLPEYRERESSQAITLVRLADTDAFDNPADPRDNAGLDWKGVW
jgi:hypothetical protein